MVIPLVYFNNRIDLIQYTHILDIYFIPHSNGSVFKWMKIFLEILAMTTQKNCSISNVNAWISDPLFKTSVRDQC